MNDESTNHLDQEVLAVLTDAIGSESVANIIKLYLTDAPNDLAQMQAAVVKKDLATIGRLSHSLKSSSANLGAMHTSKLATELEHAIAQGEQDVQAINNTLDKIRASFDQTRIMFARYTP